jgi:hypothetical protein
MGLILTGYLAQLVPPADAHDIERFKFLASGSSCNSTVFTITTKLGSKRQLRPKGKTDSTNNKRMSNRSAAGDAFEHERWKTEVTVSDPRFENAGLCSTVAHLANPVFDGMTFVKGDKGAGCRVWLLQKAQKGSADEME